MYELEMIEVTVVLLELILIDNHGWTINKQKIGSLGKQKVSRLSKKILPRKKDDLNISKAPEKVTPNLRTTVITLFPLWVPKIVAHINYFRSVFVRISFTVSEEVIVKLGYQFGATKDLLSGTLA